MTDSFETCPRCGRGLQPGFSHRAAGLSFVSPAKLLQTVSLDEDLSRAGLKKLLPSPAEYFPSYLCRSCELYLIDYSTALAHADAKKEAQSLVAQPSP